MNASAETWHLDNQTVQVTHLEKVYWPHTGFTKGEVLEYYRQIAPILLPYLKDRPVTLRMHPQGVEGTSFYLRDCPVDAPQWLRRVPYQPKIVNHSVPLPLIDTAAGLLWFANEGPSKSICGVRALRTSRGQTWPSSILMLARTLLSRSYGKRRCTSTMHLHKPVARPTREFV